MDLYWLGVRNDAPFSENGTCVAFLMFEVGQARLGVVATEGAMHCPDSFSHSWTDS